MLRTMDSATGSKIHATDGDIGKVEEFYFDDDQWAIRYLVVDTGPWILGRKVLISPLSITGTRWEEERVDTRLTKDQVKNSPDIDTKQPISRLQEREYNRYYAIPYYWGGTGTWGNAAYPGAVPMEVNMNENIRQTEQQAMEQYHLRSSHEVKGYHIHASDGEIGHVEDFIFAEETWAIRYMIVDTKNLLHGKKVILAPEWIDDVSWADSRVYMNLTKEQIKNGPEFDSSKPLDRNYEESLYDYYKAQRYWAA